MTHWIRKNLEGWGRFPVVETDVARPERRKAVLDAFAQRGDDPILAYGMGRSYGDAALLEDGKVVLTRRLDRMLAFDPDTGWLRCEAGVTLKEIIDVFLPRGFFPPVVPGTQFVTVGGAIGCNIHGKNHHVDGCFGDHVRRVELLTASGEIVICDRDNEPELFWATVGGMGLTGLILSLEVQLYPVESDAVILETVRVDNLDEFFATSDESGDFTHTVSWIDCAARGKEMGRGIFMRGRHAPAGTQVGAGPLEVLDEIAPGLLDGRPFEANWILNSATIRLFNEAYFRKTPSGTTSQTVGYIPFFFPLDAVKNWNYGYGSRGMLQYQFVVPDREPIETILREVSESGMASFLTVIKEFGDRSHGGLSFPEKGITLALDFPNKGEPLYQMLDRFDEIVASAGGKIYLGKDARLSAAMMRRMYPEWEKWKAVRDEWDPEGVFQSELGRRLELVGGNR